MSDALYLAAVVVAAIPLVAVLLALALMWATPVVVFGGLGWVVYRATPRRGSFQDSIGG